MRNGRRAELCRFLKYLLEKVKKEEVSGDCA